MIDSTLRTAALELELALESVPDEQIVAGTPQTGYSELEPFGGAGGDAGAGGGVELGVWEMTAGSMSDTEADELFVVIAGSAVVEFLDTGETVVYGVGDIGRLREGQRTIWRVQERIRKVYVTIPVR